MIYTPHAYQDFAEKHILDNPACGLLLDMGLGKTVTTLTAIWKLIYDRLEVKKVLVIAPKRVAEDTWTTEAEKWEHLGNLRISKVLGSPKQRMEALKVNADIYVINRENVVWLVTYYQSAFPFDMIVVDESSSFKNHRSARFKALRSVRPFADRVVILTGTPTPNGLLDLWAQIYLLDRGERLGGTITQYRDRYFHPTKRQGFTIFEYGLNKGEDIEGEDIYEKMIHAKIKDVCISMKSEDWLELPELVEQDVFVTFTPEQMQQYKDFERDLVLALDIEGVDDISAANAAGLSNKLRQFANGAVYDEDKMWHLVHDAKLEAIVEDVEALDGQPILIFYQYRSDLERLLKALKKFKPRELRGQKDIKDWNNRKISVLLTHAASAAFGLNLQAGGNQLAWFGLDWNLELYQQAIKRLHRQGQLSKVLMRRYLVKGTIEERVLTALVTKAGKQESLMQAVKAIIKKHKKD